MYLQSRLSSTQRRWLRQRAHPLKPVVLLGQHGLSEAVLTEVERALDYHELIKVRLNAGDRDDRDAAVAAIAERTGAELVQRIGNVAVYFRANPKLARGVRLPP
jgi:RNA-binding protein